MQPRHLGACPGLVDENQTAGIEVGLRAEPRAAAFQDVRAVLPGRVVCLFCASFCRRAKKRHRPDTATEPPSAASLARSSASVMPGAASSAARMRDACRSVCADRWSPPRRCGAALPRSRTSRAQRIALEMPIPKRAAAARRYIPSPIAATTRSRRSIESGRPIHSRPPIPATSVNQTSARLGIPSRVSRIGICSSGNGALNQPFARFGAR